MSLDGAYAFPFLGRSGASSMESASMSNARDGVGNGGPGGAGSGAVAPSDAWSGLGGPPNSGGVSGGGGIGDGASSDDVNVKEEATDEDGSNDAEGVWSPDIEQSFMEALAIYPPCGRRKIVLTEEGKMYGRNELIARYIKLRTGKTRTRKQVSSHMQVLARRKAKELQSSVKDPVKKERAMQALQHLSSAQIVSAAVMHDRSYGGSNMVNNNDVMPGSQPPSHQGNPGGPPSSMGGSMATAHNSPPVSASFGPPSGPPSLHGHGPPGGPPPSANAAAASYWPSLSGISNTGSANQWSSLPDVAIPPWQDRSIAGPKLRLVSVDAFVETHGSSQDVYNTSKHHSFATISSPTYSSPILESIDISQIADKFPERRGLKDLFDRGPQEAFFLVKFWADISTNFQNENAFYAVSMVFHGQEEFPLRLSTKVCSFGKQVVEKVEEEYPRVENGHIVYEFSRSPMCDYMINFLTKLSNLPEAYMMNTVLENFSILQVATHKDTGEVLLCIAYVLEVSSPEHGTQHVIYKLSSG